MGNLIKNKIGLILFLLVSLQIFLSFVNETKAYMIDIGVTKRLTNEITSFYYNSSTDLVKFNIEVQNRGSIAYTARTRIDILNISDSNGGYETFTAWGSEKVFIPGDKKSSEIHWYTNGTGNFTVRTRVYYAGEILERFFEVEKNESIAPSNQKQEDIFKIKNFRTHDDFIIFDLVPKTDSKDIVIIPKIFTRGWIFEQKKIEGIKEGKVKTIVLPYKAPVFATDDLKLLIVSDESKFYSEKTFTLSKRRGIEGFVFFIIDNVKAILGRCC